jgi:hypothetical protein
MINGQMHQICCIVAAAKRALKEGAPIRFAPEENRIEFRFLPQKRFFRLKNDMAKDVSLWFERCRKKKLQDVKFLCPIDVDDPQLLGFANTTQSMILCFYEDGSLTFFTPEWQFDDAQRRWNVLYTEHAWPNPPEKPHFKDNTGSFQKILEEIRQFAVKIECGGFAKTFENALNLLNGSQERPYTECKVTLPAIPQENMRIFEAAGLADVFGAMGTWNDSPPYMAHAKGLDEEYETLSHELLKNVRMAILYAVNEW